MQCAQARHGKPLRTKSPAGQKRPLGGNGDCLAATCDERLLIKRYGRSLDRQHFALSMRHNMRQATSCSHKGLADTMTRLEEEFARSVALSEWFRDALSKEGHVIADRRRMISLAFSALCLEHRAAFLLLVEHGANAAAVTLARAILEAHIRTLWANEIATEEQIDRFCSGRYDPKVEATLQALKRKGSEHRALFETLRTHHATLSDYAHGGPRLVSRWIQDHEIGPEYSEGQMIEVLQFVDIIGVMSAAAREALLDQPTQRFSERLCELLCKVHSLG